MIRAVVDVNVLFSATILARGTPYQILLAWQADRYAQICSLGMLRELEENLRDPKQAGRYQLTEQDIQAILALVRSQAELILVPEHERLLVTGDPEDDDVLATGRLAQADYLVTGDKGLLELGEYAGMRIVTPRQFMDLLESEG
jgi:putative PIN family toxin of toxin-antitoxin system